MPYPVQRYARVLNRFCVATKAFTKEDVEKILALEELQKFQKGAVGGATGKGQVNKKNRDSDVMWVMHEPNSDWLYQKFANLVSAVNYDHFIYDWHIDAGNTSSPFERKISASLILTDPSKYEGGEFECVMNGRVDEPFVAKGEIGDVIFFDSSMPHRVRPVTSGVRKSLVCWIMGKNTW